MPVIAALGTVVFAGITVGQIALMVATTLYGISRASSAKSKAERQARELADAARAAMNLKFNTMSNVGNLPVIYGNLRVGGYYCLQEVSADKKILHIIIAHAEGECGAATMMYLDDTPYTDKKFKMRKKVQVKLGLVTETFYPRNAAPYTAVVDKYEEQEQDYDLVKWEYFSGADAQPACASLIAALPDKWTAAHKLSGVAYSYVALEWNPDVWRSVPVITVQMEGKKVFDPRTATMAASSNPALALRDYLLSPRYGRGLRAADVSDAGCISAANYCDQLIDMGHKFIDTDKVEKTKLVPRYEINGVLDTSRPCLDNVQEILEHCRGTLLQADGVYRPVIDQADVPSMNFDADNMVGKLQIKMADRRDRLNQLNCRFVDPARNFVESSAAVINAAWRIEDGDILLESSRDYSLAYDERRAKFLAERALRDSRNNISISFTALSQAQLVQPTDVIAVTHETTGWQNKQFRVINVKPLPSGEVEITANEYDAGLYADKPMTALPPAPATSLPDPFEILAAPASLTLVTDNQYGWAGEVQCRIKASWPAVQGLVVDYQVRWRKQSETVWQHMSTRELSATLPVVPGTPYFVSVAAVSAFGRVGLNVTSGATGVAPAGSLPDVTGVVCEFGPAGQFIFTWAKHPDAAKYALEIITGGVTRRSDVIFTERYEYTLAMNRADSVNRTVTIRVKALANDGRGSANWVSKTENNAPPVALSGLVAWSNSLAIAFNCTPPTEVDLAGVICHLGDTPVFTPSAATLAYKGRLDTPTLLTMRAGAPLVVGKTYYLKAAAYDVFGDDGIVYSPSLLVKISTISADILEIESLGPEKLKPSLITDIGKGVTALDVALPEMTIDFDLKIDAKATKQSVTNLEARVAAGTSGNLLLNADFLAISNGMPNAWSFAGNLSNTSVGVNVLLDWTVTPSLTANTISIHQVGVGAGDFYCAQQVVAAEANKTYALSVYSGTHRATAWISMSFLDAAGATLSTFNDFNHQEAYGGKILASYKRLKTIALAPPTAVSVIVQIGKHVTISGETDSWNFFTRPQLEIVPAGATQPTEWRAGQTDVGSLSTKTELAAQIQRIDSVIADVAGKASASELSTLDAVVKNPTTGLGTKASQSALNQVIVDVAGKASASELSTLDAVVKNPTTGLDSKASQSQLNTVIADVAGKASAQSLTNLEARVSAGQSGNLLLNADFLAGSSANFIPDGWQLFTIGLQTSISLADAAFNEPDFSVSPNSTAKTWRIYQGGFAANSTQVLAQDVYAEAGKCYNFSLYTGTHRCDAYCAIEFRNNAGSVISGFSSDVNSSNSAVGGQTLAGYRRNTVTATAPVGAVSMRVLIVKNGTLETFTNSYLFFTRPMLEILPTGATGPTEWRSGQTTVGSLSTKTELAAQITRIDQVVTDVSGKASASSVTSLTSEVGNVKVTATNALQTSVDTAGKIAATAGLMLDVNGHISGTKMYNDGTTAAFDIVADVFRVSTPDSIGRGEAVFSIGKVNGVNKVGIRGDMLIDGSVTARSLSVTNLQAVTANTGTLYVTGDLHMTAGAILGGDRAGWVWPVNGAQNMYIGPNGILLGNYYTGKFLQYNTGDGSLTVRGDVLATSVTADTITANHIVARGITEVFSGAVVLPPSNDNNSSVSATVYVNAPLGSFVLLLVQGIMRYPTGALGRELFTSNVGNGSQFITFNGFGAFNCVVSVAQATEVKVVAIVFKR